MSPIQQMLLGVGAVATKTYVDDIFSTNVYAGNSASTGSGTTQAINTGFDLASEGGLVWQKGRSFSDNHFLIDTVRGNTKVLRSNTSGAETTTSLLSAFTSTGYTAGDNIYFNGTGKTFASWTFRKAPGFFDVVTYTGNGSNRTIAHSLGCVPGMILIKNVSASENWRVYHRATKATHNLQLNDTDAAGASSTPFNNTEPTASVFSVGTDGATNGNGQSIVAYLFAGGESTAATARSVDFDGSDDTLNIAASDDFHLTGDLTIEGWFKPDTYGSYNAFWCLGNFQATQGVFIYTDATQLNFWKGGGGQITTSKPTIGQWTHIAVVRSGSTVTMYINGTSVGSYTDSVDFGASNNKTFTIGSDLKNSSVNDDFFNGQISNLRVIKGTALYTSSFRPPTEPLTNITNTKLLCCNNSSVTGSTVTPSTITAASSPSASTDSPFDDPAGFVFGDAEDQNVIKCGSYTGNGSATGPEINLGFEPQWLMVKKTSDTSQWLMLDVMRGIVTGDNDAYVSANDNAAEATGANWLDVNPTGFQIARNHTWINENGGSYIFLALRRPDGYCGKPPELGTGVFAMDTGAGSSTIPNFDSGFPVDWAITRAPASATNWETGGRLIQGKWLETNNTVAESPGSYFTFDSNTGWMSGATAYNSDYQAWMWKRHAGFDVVTFEGTNSAGLQIPHNLSKVPEMMWIKNRDASENWAVYHKGLNGGTNPQDYAIRLNSTAGEFNNNEWWNDTAPTSTHFTLGIQGETNGFEMSMIAILFASVDGISKVGSYTGNDSNQTITFGFAPRFVIIKSTAANTGWVVLDTLRGWSDSDSRLIRLDRNNAQGGSDSGYGYATSTGMVLTGDGGSHTNTNPYEYIYYAHE